MLNIVASFFRLTIPSSKNDVLQRKTRTKQKCFFLHGNNFHLFFEAIHRAEMTEQKPKKIKCRRLCSNNGTSNGGLKAQWE